MDLRQAVLTCMAVFALLEFGLLPRLRNAWAQLPLIGKLNRMGAIAVCEKVRNYCLIGGATYLLLAAFVALAGIGSVASIDGIAGTLAKAQRAGEVVKRFRELWSTWIFLLAFILLALAWYRSAKRYAREKLSDLRLREYDRLMKAREDKSPEWLDLPPTADMYAVQGAIRETVSALERIPIEERKGEAAAELGRRVDELARVWTIMDLDRRLEIHWDTEPSGTSSNRFRRFFTSKGFLADMKGAGKILSYASTAFLALALVGFAAGSADGALTRRVATLADLKVSTAERQSEDDLRKAEAEATPQPANNVNSAPLTNEDRAQIRNVSQHLARVMRSNERWPEPGRNLRREVAKERIRALTATKAAETPTPYADGTPEDIANAGPPKDALVDSIEHDLVVEADRSPKFRAKLRAWMASHQEAAEIGDLRDYFVEQLTDALFEGAPKPHGALAEKAADLFTDQMKKQATRAAKTAENRFMLAMLQDAPGNSAWEAVRNEKLLPTVLPSSVFDDLAKTFPDSTTQAQWAEDVRKRRIAVLSEERGSGADRIRQAVADMPPLTTLDREAEIANLASTYEAEFPLLAKTYVRDSVLEDLANVHKEVQERLKSAGLELPDMAQTEDVGARVARSTNVEALRNFSRVGGILIGRPPEGKTATLHVKDVSWTRQVGLVTLAVEPGTGPPVRLGPFEPETVNRALAYAVDGRVTAVTVLNAELIDRDQVMIHPALRDTGTGARFGHADEWIFDILDPDPPAPQSELRRSLERLYVESKIYAKALATIKAGKTAISDVSVKRLRAIEESAAGIDLSTASSFDRGLLALAAKCIAADDTEDGFASCVLQGATDKKSVASLKRASAPRTQFVSQIYEQPYDLDPDLRFLRRPQPDNGVWPLEFTVQMIVNDKEHVTFPQFKGTAKSSSTAAILKGVQERGEGGILQDLRSFTLLERFFQTALNGQLGDDFPVEKLAGLAEATRNATATCPTPRWIHRKSILDESKEAALGNELGHLPDPSKFTEKAPTAASAALRARMQGCAALLSGAGAEFVSAERIQSACVVNDVALDKACQAAKAGSSSEACFFADDVTLAITSIVNAHQLREALGAVNVPKHIESACRSVPEKATRVNP